MYGDRLLSVFDDRTGDSDTWEMV